MEEWKGVELHRWTSSTKANFSLNMIPIISVVEKSDQAARFFRAKQKLTPLHPGPPGTGMPFVFFEYRR
jgi:hypothetical protein